MGSQKKMSLSIEFQLKTQTQNSLKMSNSTQNLDSKLTENESLNSKPRLKTR